MRRPLIVANWKMNLGRVDEARDLVRRLRPGLGGLKAVEVVICPPFTVLTSMAEILAPSPIRLGAQNVHHEAAGAYTGEVAPTMLAGICRYVIVGHSERRAAGETDMDVGRKTGACIDHGVTPIICVGEDADQLEAGLTDTVVASQVRAALASVQPSEAGSCVIAYEPVWAIGTGTPATPPAANRTMGMAIRQTVADLYGDAASRAVRLLYGGSVSAASVSGFMTMPEIDGALVGGASLTAEFLDLAREADRCAG